MANTGSGGFRPSLKTVSQGVTAEAEFLASEHYMAKRVGVTIDADAVTADGDGNKILTKGTLLCKITASGKYGPYDSGAGDGREEVGDDAGFLWESLDLTDGDVVAGVILHGSVLEARLAGSWDSSAKAALAGRFVFQ